MKKILLALTVIASLASQAFTAGPVSQNVSVSANIATLFDLALDKITLPFGTLNAGTEAIPQVVKCTITSNIGNIWHIAISAAPLTHTDGTTIIPPADFQYFHTFNNPDGTEIPPVGVAAPVPSSLTTVFSAGPGIFNANTTDFGLGFKIIVPGAQKTGSYNTTITITLVDGV